MRHKKKGKTLGRKRAPRKALMRNLATSFIIYEKVKTTKAKAKVLRPFVEKIITLGKVDSLHNRRQVRKILYLPGATKKVFEIFGPRFKNVNGGYTRIVKLNPRLGDNAEMAILEFVGGDESATATKQENNEAKKQKVESDDKVSKSQEEKPQK